MGHGARVDGLVVVGGVCGLCVGGWRGEGGGRGLPDGEAGGEGFLLAVVVGEGWAVLAGGGGGAAVAWWLLGYHGHCALGSGG